MLCTSSASTDNKMIGEFILKLLIVTSVVIVYCDGGTYLTSLSENTKKLIEEAKTYKHERCLTSYRINCNTTKYPNYDFELTRWYYSATSQSCFPMFLARDQIKQCAGIVDWVIDLPYTKKECEDLCGEPCTIVHGNGKTESGICMINCKIPVPDGSPAPCPPSKYRCCPRDYEPRTIPIMKPTYSFKSAFINMIDANKSMVANFTMQIHIP